MSDIDVDDDFEALLEFIHVNRGFDFTGYKRSSLMRRVQRRMQQVGTDSFAEYLDLLQADQDEFGSLFNTILINVTGFFRDATSWSVLQDELLPALIKSRSGNKQIRVWSAGCATGQEAYSLAIVLAEILGVDQFRQRVKIYATDADEDALVQARAAVYADRELRGCPPGYLEKYFEKTGSHYVFRKDLRRCVIFGRNDLVQDAPISKIDLLLRRNTLMYLNTSTQAQVLRQLHFALADGGLLFLGRAEMLLSHTSLFVPIDLKRRFFRKPARSAAPEQTLLVQPGVERDQLAQQTDQLLHEQALLSAPTATTSPGPRPTANGCTSTSK